jgi:Flp pilus assembly protein TadG
MMHSKMARGHIVLTKIAQDESGQVLILTAVCMTVLLGFTALAVDVGMLFRAKRNLQTAADAAATAGALDYLYNGSSTSAQTAGKAASAQNGFTDGTGGVAVAINLPPASGPNTSGTGYVEAIVQAPNPTYFMKALNIASVTVSARAVAGTPTAGGPCIWLMGKSGTDLYLQGSYDIEASGCGVYVNSNSSNALGVTGGGGTFNAAYLDVVGNSTSNHATSPTSPTLNAAPRSNPFGGLTGPTPTNGGCTSTNTTATSITGTVAGPGLNNAVCYTKAVTINAATLGPGVYAFENGVTISGHVTVNGGTLDVESGTFNQSNGTLSLTAPTSGTYNGIAIMQPASNTNELQIQFGSSTETLDGMIYAPGAEVYLQDHGGSVTATGIVAASMYDKSSVVTIHNYNVVHASTSPFRYVTMVE